MPTNRTYVSAAAAAAALLAALCLWSPDVRAVTANAGQPEAYYQAAGRTCAPAAQWTLPSVRSSGADSPARQRDHHKRLRAWVRSGLRDLRRRSAATRAPQPNPRGEGSTLAIASLVLGVVGLVGIVVAFPLTLIPSILAAIFGFVAKRKARDGYHDYGGIAAGGLILGIVGAALQLLLVLLIAAAVLATVE